MESVDPETAAEKQTCNDEEPNRSTGFGVDPSCAESVVCTDPRPHGVRDIVGPVRDGHHNRRDNLAVCPHVLDAVVVAFGAGVDVAEEC